MTNNKINKLTFSNFFKKSTSINNFVKEDITFIRFCQERKISIQKALFADPYFRFIRILTKLEKFTQKKLNGIWLDIGCHGAQFISMLKNSYPGLQLTGIDQWDLPKKINWIDFKYYQFDIQDDWTTLFDEKIQSISVLEVLEHIIDTDAFLRRCHSVLDDDGLLVLSTPNINNLRNRILVPLGFYPVHLEYRNIIHHVRLYNVEKIKLHLSEHKFKTLEIIGVNFLPARWNKFEVIRILNNILADLFPSMCSNIIVFAKKAS